MRKVLINSGNKIGIVGEYTGFESLYVGDIVVLDYHKGYLTTSIVCKENDKFFVMGLYSNEIDSLVKNNRLRTVISYEFITDDIVRSLGRGISLKEIAVEKMTIKQIEEKLGYPIEIVEGEC